MLSLYKGSGDVSSLLFQIYCTSVMIKLIRYAAMSVITETLSKVWNRNHNSAVPHKLRGFSNIHNDETEPHDAETTVNYRLQLGNISNNRNVSHIISGDAHSLVYHVIFCQLTISVSFFKLPIISKHSYIY